MLLSFHGRQELYFIQLRIPSSWQSSGTEHPRDLSEEVQVLCCLGTWPGPPPLGLSVPLAPWRLWVVFCCVFKVLILAGDFLRDSLLVAMLHSMRFLSVAKMVSFFFSCPWNGTGPRRSSIANTHIFVDYNKQGRGLAGISLSLPRGSPSVLFHWLLPQKKSLTFSLLNSGLNVYSNW